MSAVQPSNSTAALVPSSSNGKRLSTISKQGSQQGSPGKTKAPSALSGTGGAGAKDVVSPGELCGFVDSLLSQLETRFDDMSDQMMTRMNDMSVRIDALENTIQDMLHEGIDGPLADSPSVKR